MINLRSGLPLLFSFAKSGQRKWFVSRDIIKYRFLVFNAALRILNSLMWWRQKKKSDTWFDFFVVVDLVISVTVRIDEINIFRKVSNSLNFFFLLLKDIIFPVRLFYGFWVWNFFIPFFKKKADIDSIRPILI